MKTEVLFLLSLIALPLWSQSPAGIKGEKLWFNAQNFHTERMAKNDSTATDTTLFKSTLFNYNEALIFDGETGVLDSLSENIHNVKKITAYLIYKTEDVGKEQSLWSLQTPTINISLTTDSIASFDKNISYTGGRTEIAVINRYYEKWRKLPKTETNKSSNYFYLGVPNPNDSLTQKFKGSIAEFILYDRKLRPNERAVLETYLALRYGININRDYMDSSENTIWSTEDNDPYSYRVSGIGRDNKASIFQKQSGSCENNGVLVISAGILQESNQLNTTHINGGDFLIWGDNNGLNEITTTPDTSLPLLDRKWLLQASGATSNSIGTEVHVDVSHFFPGTKLEENDYILVIDRGGSGTFEQKSLEFIYADPEYSTGKHVFRNVFWDIDNSGTDSFTFIQIPKLQLKLTPLEKTDCSSSVTNEEVAYTIAGGLPPYQYESLHIESNLKKQWKEKRKTNAGGTIDTPEKGQYQITVTDRLGRVAKDTVIIGEYIPLQINLGENKVISDASILLDSSKLINQTEVQYRWESDQGDVFTTPKITIKEAGTYTVTATDQYGCTATDTVTVFRSVVEQFVVYPNISADGSFTVKVSLKEPSSGLLLNIYDLQGKLHQTHKIEERTTDYKFIGVLDGPSGLYTFHITSAKINATGKFIKK